MEESSGMFLQLSSKSSHRLSSWWLLFLNTAVNSSQTPAAGFSSGGCAAVLHSPLSHGLEVFGRSFSCWKTNNGSTEVKNNIVVVCSSAKNSIAAAILVQHASKSCARTWKVPLTLWHLRIIIFLVVVGRGTLGYSTPENDLSWDSKAFPADPCSWMTTAITTTQPPGMCTCSANA